MRLAYLNQQGDKGALSLRRSEACLTVAELNAIGNKQLRENHPLNCAKLNAKPYPYFDGEKGPPHFHFLSKWGWPLPPAKRWGW